MKYLNRRKPYSVGNLWKIEYPRDDRRNFRWGKYYALWRYNPEWHKWQFDRFLSEAEASCYGRRPNYV